jgi:hypothetical protein
VGKAASLGGLGFSHFAAEKPHGSCGQSARKILLCRRRYRERTERKIGVNSLNEVIQIMMTKGCSPSHPKSALRPSKTPTMNSAVTSPIRSIAEPELSPEHRGSQRRRILD